MIINTNNLNDYYSKHNHQFIYKTSIYHYKEVFSLLIIFLMTIMLRKSLNKIFIIIINKVLFKIINEYTKFGISK